MKSIKINKKPEVTFDPKLPIMPVTFDLKPEVPTTKTDVFNYSYPFFLGNLLWILRESRLKRAWNYAFLACQIQNFLTQTPLQARSLLASFVPHKNLPKPMIQTLLSTVIIVYDKIRTFLFFWWFILNVLWLIFKTFWSKSIDSGKKRADFKVKIWAQFNQTILSQNTFRSNKYFSHCLFCICTIKVSKNIIKNPAPRGAYPPSDTPLCVPANHSLMSLIKPISTPLYANKEAYIWI